MIEFLGYLLGFLFVTLGGMLFFHVACKRMERETIRRLREASKKCDLTMVRLVYRGGHHDVWCDGEVHVTLGGGSFGNAPTEYLKVGSIAEFRTSVCDCQKWKEDRAQRAALETQERVLRNLDEMKARLTRKGEKHGE